MSNMIMSYYQKLAALTGRNGRLQPRLSRVLVLDRTASKTLSRFIDFLRAIVVWSAGTVHIVLPLFFLEDC